MYTKYITTNKYMLDIGKRRAVFWSAELMDVHRHDPF